jgi:hypothetical protein
MKRFARLFASLALSAFLVGCGEAPTPPSGTLGTGPPTGPPTAGVAKKNHDEMLKRLSVAVDKAARKSH